MTAVPEEWVEIQDKRTVVLKRKAAVLEGRSEASGGLAKVPKRQFKVPEGLPEVLYLENMIGLPKEQVGQNRQNVVEDTEKSTERSEDVKNEVRFSKM